MILLDAFKNVNFNSFCARDTVILYISIFHLMFFFKILQYRKILIYPYFVKKKKIEIKDQVSNKTLWGEKMPVNKEDVKEYINKVREISPSCLVNIDEIVLSEREPFMDKNIIASYCPNGSRRKRGRIELYTFQYNPVKDEYYIEIDSTGTKKLVYNHVEAKEMLLFSLGHELGHNEIYLNSGHLNGDYIEIMCDKFSEELGIIKNIEDMFLVKK